MQQQNNSLLAINVWNYEKEKMLASMTIKQPVSKLTLHPTKHKNVVLSLDHPDWAQLPEDVRDLLPEEGNQRESRHFGHAEGRKGEQLHRLYLLQTSTGF